MLKLIKTLPQFVMRGSQRFIHPRNCRKALIQQLKSENAGSVAVECVAVCEFGLLGAELPKCPEAVV